MPDDDCSVYSADGYQHEVKSHAHEGCGSLIQRAEPDLTLEGKAKYLRVKKARVQCWR
jgi:hypothetical protein